MSFTEFYCNPSTGANNAAGSTESATPAYTATNGGWNSGTGVWTPTAGDPSATVSIGDWASIYTDGLNVTGFVGRVTGVSSTTITVSTSVKSGTVPTTAGTGISCKVGGAWQGPNGAVSFPFNFVQSTMTLTSTSPPRVNFKNNATYSIAAAMTHALPGPITFQGYTTTAGDGGRATIDGGSPSAAFLLLNVTTAAPNVHLADLILQNNGTTTGTPGGLGLVGTEALLERVSVLGVRGAAFTVTVTAVTLIECEAQTTANGAGFFCNSGANTAVILNRCTAHDCTGSSGHGFTFVAGFPALTGCIADKNGGHGFHYSGTNGANLAQCDAHNNVGDGLNFAPSAAATLYVENSNFVSNGAYGVNVGGTASLVVLRNCGFRANTSGETTGSPTVNAGPISYTATPYAAAATTGAPRAGNFTIALAEAHGTGRGGFTQSSATYSSTTSAYTDVGAAQHADLGTGGAPTVSEIVAGILASKVGLAIDANNRVDVGSILGVAVTDSDGTAAAVSSTTITLAASEPNTAQYYRGQRIRIVSATTGRGQERVITDYSTGRVATLDAAWAVTPTGTVEYQFAGDATAGKVADGAIASASFAAGATLPRVTLADTVTTLNGHTPQTGDAYAVVNHGTYGNAQLVRSTTPANTLDVSATGEAGLDFNNVKQASGATTLSNITVPTVTAVINDVGITQAAADKAWSTTARALTDKAGFSLSSAGVQAIWDALTSALTTANTIGKKLADWVLGSDSKAVLSNNAHTGAVIPTVTTLTGHTAQTGDSFARIGAAGAGLTALGDTRLANLDAAVSTRSTYAGGAVASVTGNVGGNLTGTVGGLATAAQDDVAAAVWDADPADHDTASTFGLNLDVAVSTRSTYAGGDTAGTTTILSRLTNTRATNLDNLDAAVSTRSTYAGGDTAGTTTLLSRLTSGRATSLDNLDASITSRPTTAAIVAGVWDEPQSGHTVAGSFGLRIDATVSSRLATAGYTVPPTAGQNATATWSEAIPGAFGAGTAGEKLNSASSAGDPWSTALPGAYGAGTAGSIVGNRIDVATSTRADGASYTPARAIKLDNLDAAITTRSTFAGGAVASVTGNVGGNVVGSVASVTGNVGGSVASVTGNVSGNVTGTVGGLATAAKLDVENAVWNAAQSGHTAAGSFGLYLDVATSSRLPTTSYTTPPTASANATAVWSEAIPGAFGAGTAGAKLNAAGSAGDPWSTVLPGAYGAGTAGSIVGNRIDATVSSRLPTTSYVVPPTAQQNATAVWTEAIPGAFGIGSAGAKLNAAGAAGDPWATAIPGAYAAGTAGNIVGNRLDAAVSAPVTVGTNNDKVGYALAQAFPANFSALLISAGGLAAIDTTRTFGVRNQDAVTAPTIADAFQGAWSEAFGTENIAGVTYTKDLPDGASPARTFTLDDAGAANQSLLIPARRRGSMPIVTDGLGAGSGSASLLTSGLSTTGVQFRDDRIFEDIVARLDATGQFAAVLLEVPIGRTDETPIAHVDNPDDWEDVDDADPTVLLHRARFRVTLTVREDPEQSAYPATARLTRVVKKALNGKSLAGETLPDLTLIRRGRQPPKSKGLDRLCVLEGEFAYLLEGFGSGFDTEAIE